MVGIVFHDNSEAARDFMDRMAAAWPARHGSRRAVAQAFGIYGPPETFFIDANGGVAAGRSASSRHRTSNASWQALAHPAEE